ncbi:MAG: hypothetical protein HFI58_02690 [Lachnospiraceae bacterium]|nr:hypothetical protein [Lachnospiraceae bacterium]
MERRYYLRGLGVGIAVTAVIMGVMTSRDAKMTDREVIARAKELGMVESTVLLDENDEASNGEEGADADNETEEEAGAAGEDPAGDGTVPDAGEEAGGKDANEAVDVTGTGAEDDRSGSEAGDMPENEDTGEPDMDDADRQTAADGGQEPESAEEDAGQEDKVTSEEEKKALITSAAVKKITVNSGDGSHTVAQKLADAGVIISAQSFDDYLCRYGYDKKLRTGTFSIPADASDEQIARIVTGAE